MKKKVANLKVSQSITDNINEFNNIENTIIDITSGLYDIGNDGVNGALAQVGDLTQGAISIVYDLISY